MSRIIVPGRSLTLLIALLWLSGCGSGGNEKRDSGGTGAIGEVKEASRVHVALVPTKGGELKYLHFDSLAIIPSGLVLPGPSERVFDVPGTDRLAVLTDESVYLLPKSGGEARSIPLPGLSPDVLIRFTAEGMLILDRGAGRLYDVNLLEGHVQHDRSFAQQPEEIFYFPEGDRIAVVIRRGRRGVVTVLRRGGGESMTVNLETIATVAGAREEGLLCSATSGEGGSKLVIYRVVDLSRVFEIPLEKTPGSMACPTRSGKIYVYFPESGIIVVYGLEEGRIVSEIPVEGTPGGRLQTDETGAHVFLLPPDERDGGHVTVIATESDLIVAEIDGVGGEARLIATPDSRFILLQDRNGSRIRVYGGDGFPLQRVIMEETPMAVALVRATGPAETVDAPGFVAASEKSVRSQEPEAISPPVETSEDWPAIFTLQFFSSDDPKAAEKVAERLIQAGFPAYIEEAAISGKKTWYRVRGGGFATREDAGAVGGYVRTLLGLEFWVATLDDPASIARSTLEGGGLFGHDMDADGHPEIVVVGLEGSVRVFTLRGNRYIPRWSYHLPGRQVLCGRITYGDHNGDGLPEAILPLCPPEQDHVIAWNGDEFTGGSG
jgi:hypothetical protein